MAEDAKALKQDLTRRMDGAIETLKKEFAGLRTGRASPALLEPVRVEAYGGNSPLNQVANISVGGPGLLVVQVFDRSLTKAVEVAIRGVRRDGMERVKAMTTDKKAPISEDEGKRAQDDVQKLTDQYIKQVDTLLAEKEKDIKTV